MSEIPPPPPIQPPPIPTPSAFDSGSPTQEERNMGMWVHIGALAGWLTSLIGIPVPFIGAIIVAVFYFTNKDKSAYITHHARQGLYWMCLAFGAGVALTILTVITCGLGALITVPLMLVVVVADVVVHIIAAMKAKEGVWYKFPITGEWTFIP